MGGMFEDMHVGPIRDVGHISDGRDAPMTDLAWYITREMSREYRKLMAVEEDRWLGYHFGPQTAQGRNLSGIFNTRGVSVTPPLPDRDRIAGDVPPLMLFGWLERLLTGAAWPVPAGVARG